MGPRVAEFERAFAKRFGARFAVMVNSGSSANLVAIASLFHRRENPLVRGDEAIVPAVAWSTTYAPLWQYGLKMTVVDVNPSTLNVEIEAVRQAITPRTRLLVGVSILGNPAPLEELRKLADEHGLIFFEDNCESLGAKLNGQFTGSFGLLSTCSFFFAHHISTMEGGMLLTSDPELFELARALRAHGWTRELQSDSQIYTRDQDEFQEAYRFLVPGYNLRPLEMSGAAGLCQLRKIDAMISARRKNAAHFQELMKGESRFQIQEERGESSWYCFPMIVRPGSGLRRAEVLARLREAQIQFRMITGGNVMRHDYAARMGLAATGALPGADLVHDHGLFVGNAPFDLCPQIDRLVRVLRSC